MRPRWKKIVLFAPLAISGMAAFIAIGSVIVQQLWNWLLPPLLGWHQITFWQALGILVLCRILFGGHGWRGPMRSSMRRRMQERMAERCDWMTPEEREQFRERFRRRMRERFGFGPSPAESKGQQSPG